MTGQPSRALYRTGDKAGAREVQEGLEDSSGEDFELDVREGS